MGVSVFWKETQTFGHDQVDDPFMKGAPLSGGRRTNLTQGRGEGAQGVPVHQYRDTEMEENMCIHEAGGHVHT